MSAFSRPCSTFHVMNSFLRSIATRSTKITRFRSARARPFLSLTSLPLCCKRWQLDPSDVVLEVGTGSGYQTALLSELTREVYSVERHASLAHAAEATLARLGYTNVKVLLGDGSHGLAERAPFDAIVVSAAAPQIPPPLFEQLHDGGRMVIPVGPPQAQELQLVRKQAGQPVVANLEGCRFVPLIGSEGYRSGW